MDEILKTEFVYYYAYCVFPPHKQSSETGSLFNNLVTIDQPKTKYTSCEWDCEIYIN